MIVKMIDKDGVRQRRHINPKNYDPKKHELTERGIKACLLGGKSENSSL